MAVEKAERKSLLTKTKSQLMGTAWDKFDKETTIVDDIRDFASETSAHGVKYIFEGPRRIVKAMFLILWISLTIYAGITITLKVMTFFTKPTGTKFDVVIDEHDSTKNHGIKFPTISVCSANKVKKSFLDAEENRLIKEYFEIVDTYDTSVLKNLSDRFKDEEDEMSSIKDLTYESVLEKGGPEPNRFLMCSSKRQDCYSSADFMDAHGELKVSTMENSLSGRCWRVNPEGLLEGKMGDYGSLKLQFFADVQDYSARSADVENHGFIVAFHDHSTYGATQFTGFLMSPGNYYKADLRLKTTERRKDKPKDGCNATRNMTLYGVYNEGACVLGCKDEYLYDKCKCVNVVPPMNNGTYESCSLEKWVDCGLAHYTDWYRQYIDTNSSRDPLCPCDLACNEIKYEADISTSGISTAYALSLYPWIQDYLGNPAYGFSKPEFNISYATSDAVLENLMVVEILFTSMQKYAVKEVITYDLGNLFGDVGGVLGLFLGASIFTILEFVLFFVVSIAKYCCKSAGWKTAE